MGMPDILANQGGEAGTPEAGYRAVVVDATNAVVKVETLQTTQLGEAAVIIHSMAAAGYIDLWDGRRFIQRFRPEDL